MLIEKLDSFAAAPFTIQRISELLSDPRKQYSRIDKFMRAVEKTILVVSTVPPGRHRSESENGDSLDSALNGDFATEVNVDIDMEHDASFTKELAVAAPRKQANHEVSDACHETATIKKNISPTKEDVAGTSESAGEKSQNKEVAKDVGVEVVVTVECATAAVKSKTNLESNPVIKEAADSTLEQSGSQKEELVKTDVPLLQQSADTVTKPAIAETALNEPIRSSENEILIDTSEIISQTTPLAALENIVAVRTEPIAETLEHVEQKPVTTNLVTPEPETNENREEVIVQPSTASVEDDTESQPKRLKISEKQETSETEIKAEAEKVPQVEQSIPEIIEKSVENPVAVSAVLEKTIEEQIPSIPPIEAAVETIVPVIVEPVEEKIDEPIPEITEIPIEIIPLASDDIAETPSAEIMETVPTISENKMSLDEDEPPAIELEMTPIANKMDTDEADTAPMDFEDSSNEPMDQ